MAKAGRRESMMTEIRIVAGAWEAGSGTYADALLRLPNGDLRGLETVVDLSAGEPEAPPRRRIGIAGGLRSALKAAGPLPRPLDLAATMVGLGLGALGGDLHAMSVLQLRFADGASVRIETDPATAALMKRDHTVIRLALARLMPGDSPTAPLLPGPILALPAPFAPAPPPAPRAEPGSEREIPSIFEYEKRRGRLRRMAVAKLAVAKLAVAKASDEA